MRNSQAIFIAASIIIAGSIVGLTMGFATNRDDAMVPGAIGIIVGLLLAAASYDRNKRELK